MKYKIYLDIDDTISNFSLAVSKLMGRTFKSALARVNGELEAELWECIKNAHYNRGLEFWYSLDFLPDAHLLLDYLSKYEIEFLTATHTEGRDMNAENQKRRWVKERFGDTKVTVVLFGKDKAEFAAPNHILIDDTIDVIENWQLAGGIGILHTSASDTIDQLKDLGLCSGFSCLQRKH